MHITGNRGSHTWEERFPHGTPRANIWKKITPTISPLLARRRFFDRKLKWEILKMVKPHENASCTKVKNICFGILFTCVIVQTPLWTHLSWGSWKCMLWISFLFFPFLSFSFLSFPFLSFAFLSCPFLFFLCFSLLFLPFISLSLFLTCSSTSTFQQMSVYDCSRMLLRTWTQVGATLPRASPRANRNIYPKSERLRQVWVELFVKYVTSWANQELIKLAKSRTISVQ